MADPIQKKKKETLRIDASNIPIGRKPAADDFEYYDPLGGLTGEPIKVGKSLPPSLPEPPDVVPQGTKTRAQAQTELQANKYGLKKVAKANAMKKRYADSK